MQYAILTIKLNLFGLRKTAKYHLVNGAQHGSNEMNHCKCIKQNKNKIKSILIEHYEKTNKNSSNTSILM